LDSSGGAELRQPEEASGILGGARGERAYVGLARRGEPRNREAHPRGFVSFAAMRNGSEVRRIGFGEQPVVGDKAKKRLVRPLLEGDDAAERDVPTAIERQLGEADAAIVYHSDVVSAGGRIRGVQIPASVNQTLDYPLIRLTSDPTTAEFMTYVLSDQGRKRLRDNGFLTP